MIRVNYILVIVIRLCLQNIEVTKVAQKWEKAPSLEEAQREMEALDN